MKILSNLLLCALILCAVSSCQKDEENSPITIQGKWEITAVSCQDGIQTVSENGTTSGGAFVFEGRSFSSTIEFNADATFNGTGHYTRVFSSFIGGTMMNETFSANDFDIQGDWEKLDTYLTLNHADVESFEIIELTANEMTLKFELDETLEYENRSVNNVGTVFYSMDKK